MRLIDLFPLQGTYLCRFSLPCVLPHTICIVTELQGFFKIWLISNWRPSINFRYSLSLPYEIIQDDAFCICSSKLWLRLRNTLCEKQFSLLCFGYLDEKIISGSVFEDSCSTINFKELSTFRKYHQIFVLPHCFAISSPKKCVHQYKRDNMEKFN